LFSLNGLLQLTLDDLFYPSYPHAQCFPLRTVSSDLNQQ
jgi:hypothetical protein